METCTRSKKEEEDGKHSETKMNSPRTWSPELEKVISQRPFSCLQLRAWSSSRRGFIFPAVPTTCARVAAAPTERTHTHGSIPSPTSYRRHRCMHAHPTFPFVADGEPDLYYPEAYIYVYGYTADHYALLCDVCSAVLRNYEIGS